MAGPWLPFPIGLKEYLTTAERKSLLSESTELSDLLERGIVGRRLLVNREREIPEVLIRHEPPSEVRVEALRRDVSAEGMPVMVAADGVARHALLCGSSHETNAPRSDAPGGTPGGHPTASFRWGSRPPKSPGESVPASTRTPLRRKFLCRVPSRR